MIVCIYIWSLSVSIYILCMTPNWYLTSYYFSYVWIGEPPPNAFSGGKSNRNYWRYVKLAISSREVTLKIAWIQSTKFVVRSSISTRQKTAVTHAKQEVQCTLPVASFFNNYGQHCVIYYTNIIIKTITKELSVELVPDISLLLLKWTIHGNLEKNILSINVNNYLHSLVLCSFFISHSWEILSTLRYKMCISTRPCNM